MLGVIGKHFLSRGKEFQSLRWYRKPRWVPIAKSKLFYIPERPVVPREEKNELDRVNKNYHTQLRTVRKFLIRELRAERQTLANIRSEESRKEIAANFERCVAENDVWNAEVAKLREERMQRQQENRREMLLVKLEYKNRQKEKNIMKAEKRVLKQIEDSKTFVTRETLDEAINKAVASVVAYDYAIDLLGNTVKYEKSNPTEKEDTAVEA